MSSEPVARVLILDAPGCRYCGDAKALLARLAAEFALEVETTGAHGEPGRSLALEHGVLFPPGIFIDGRLVQYGRPSEGRLRAHLGKLGVPKRAAPGD